MSLRRVTSLPSEQQFSRARRLRVGQCARCFNTSAVKLEEGAAQKGSDKSTSDLRPQRSISRKERASMISDEVSNIQRNPSSRARSRPPREQQSSQPKHGKRSLQLGQSQTRNKDESTTSEQLTEVRNVRPRNQPGQQSSASAITVKSQGIPFKPQALDRLELLSDGQGSATIANGNFEGVIEERLRSAVTPGWRGESTAAERAWKLWKQQLVRFDNPKQATRAGEDVRKYVAPQLLNAAKKKKHRGYVEKRLSEAKFERMPAEVATLLSDRFVKGVYDAEGVLNGEQKYKQPVLNSIAEQLTMNGTFLARDSSRLLAKVQSLLPASAPGAAKQKRPVKQAA